LSQDATQSDPQQSTHDTPMVPILSRNDFR
jgi:hypothetical protein